MVDIIPEPVSDAAKRIADIGKLLSNRIFWFRVLTFVVGVWLVWGGFLLILSQSKLGKAAINIASPGGKVGTATKIAGALK